MRLTCHSFDFQFNGKCSIPYDNANGMLMGHFYFTCGNALLSFQLS